MGTSTDSEDCAATVDTAMGFAILAADGAANGAAVAADDAADGAAGAAAGTAGAAAAVATATGIAFSIAPPSCGIIGVAGTFGNIVVTPPV